MSKMKLIDRVVVEVLDAKCDDCPNSYVAARLREIADLIEVGVKGGNVAKPEDKSLDVLWEHEMTRYGGFKMGASSIIRDTYYGAKQTFEVCCVKREDLENRDFDTSKLTAEDMERIAAKAGDLILDGCDYWTGVVEAARYWDVPTKDEED